MSTKNDKQKKRGLGRGLSTLMADVNDAVENAPMSDDSGATGSEIRVPVERIHPNPDQPRRVFDQEKLEELADSIGEKGVIQPLIVRESRTQAGEYEIVAGERRWRASQLAKLHELPVVVRDYTDTEVLEIAIIENIQRADLNAIEEAAGYVQLMERFGHTQEQLSEALGKSRSHIANMMRLLQLPADVQGYLEAGTLSAGHARALITADNPSELAREVIKKGLSVRDTEKLVKKGPATKKDTNAANKALSKDADTRALEGDLSANAGVKVSINHNEGSQKGQVVLSYSSLDELDKICALLSKS